MLKKQFDNLSPEEQNIFYHLTKVVPNGQYTQMIHDVVRYGNAEKFKTLLGEIKQQALDKNGDYLKSLIGDDSVKAILALKESAHLSTISERTG